MGSRGKKRGNGGGERQIPGNSEAQQQDRKIFTAASLTLPVLLKKVFILRKEEKKKRLRPFPEISGELYSSQEGPQGLS